MKKVENKKDYDNLIAQKKPVLLDFYADWCPPCQALLPIVEKLSVEYKGSVKIQKVNIDENKELASQFQVRSIPALFFIKNEEIVDRVIGLTSDSVLREKLTKIIN